MTDVESETADDAAGPSKSYEITRIVRRTLTELAIRGKLTRREADDAPVEDALREAATDRDSYRKARSQERRARRSGADSGVTVSAAPPFEAPSGWAWARFDQVATVASRLVDPAGYLDSPHIAPNHIEKETGRLLPYRTVREDKVTSSKHLFEPGQVLYSKIRPNLCKATMATFAGLCSADMYPIKAHISADYLLAYMLSPTFTRTVTAEDSRLAMPKVNQEQLGAAWIMVPPAGEQVRLVRKLHGLVSACDELESRLEAQRLQRERLVAALFGGLIAADDTSDFEALWRRIFENFSILFG